MTKVCEWCGELFEVDENNKNELRRLYCGDFCRTEAWNKKARDRVRIGKRGYNVVCEICGKVFLTNRPTAKTCGPDCYYERQKIVKRENYYRNKAEKEALAKGLGVPQKKKKQMRIETLTEVQRKAQAAGMTYGKYMEQQFLKQLEEEREKNGK